MIAQYSDKREYIKLPLTQGTYDTGAVLDKTGMEFSICYGMTEEAKQRAAFIVQTGNTFDALLAACKAFVSWSTQNSSEYTAFREVIEMARAAIAQAEGREGDQ